VLPLGIISAVALFQRQMEELLGEDLLAVGVKVYLDDILSFTKTLLDHLALLNKCTFAQDSAEFLGYKITPQGISIGEGRMQALLED
jgi:hypothetical protein